MLRPCFCDDRCPMQVKSRQVIPGETICRNERAALAVSTDSSVHGDAFNPQELLMAAISSCVIAGIEKTAPGMQFAYDGVEVVIQSTRQDIPSKIDSIRYDVLIDTRESEQRIRELAARVNSHNTVCNSLAQSLAIQSTFRKA